MMTAMILLGGAAVIGSGSFLAGRYTTGGDKPSDAWLLGAFAAGVLAGALLAKG